MMAFIVSLVCTSCQEEGITSEEVSSEDSSIHMKRSYDEALAIAQESLSMLDDAKTRSGQKRTIDLSNTQYVLSNRTRSGQDTLDTLLYVFNFADDAGYAVISTNAAATGLLAITEAGNYNETELKKNGGLALFIEKAKVYSRGGHLIEPGLNPFVDTLSSVLIEYVNPLIEVTWGQCFPEGLYCPNTIAGCTNTATAQIASYFEYPTQLQLDFAQADSSSVTLNWTAMKQHIRGSSSCISHNNCTASVEAHKNIGRLCRQCAYYNMSSFYKDSLFIFTSSPLPHDYYSYTAYISDGTYTRTAESYTGTALLAFGYSVTSTIYYFPKCTQTYLDNGWPIIMCGLDNPDKGHTWVADGYKYYEDTLLSYITPLPSIITQYRYYNHFNWGWDGSSNGYFYDGVFNSSNAYTYDTSPSSQVHSYSDIILSAVHR